MAVAVIAAGCATTSGIVPRGGDEYAVHHFVPPLAGGTEEAKKRAFADAARTCERDGSELVSVSPAVDEAATTAGHYSIVFSCSHAGAATTKPITPTFDLAKRWRGQPGAQTSYVALVERNGFSGMSDAGREAVFKAAALLDAGRAAEAISELRSVSTVSRTTQAEVAVLLGAAEEMLGELDVAWLVFDAYQRQGTDSDFLALANARRSNLGDFPMRAATERLERLLADGQRADAEFVLRLIADSGQPADAGLRAAACRFTTTTKLNAPDGTAQRNAELTLRLDPDCVVAVLQTALAEYEAHRADRALALFRRAASLDKKNFVARAMIGELYAAQGDVELAIESLVEALPLAPDADAQKAVVELLADLQLGLRVRDLTHAAQLHRGLGTAFAVADDGFYVTCNHVVEGAVRVGVVLADGTFHVARVLKTDVEGDLALLRIDVATSSIPLAGGPPTIGTRIFTVGFPQPAKLGLSPKLTDGSVSGLLGARDISDRFQISAPIHPGNSGGAVVDDRGNVVGVVTSAFDTRSGMQNVSYAVSLERLRAFLAGASASEPMSLPSPNRVRHIYGDINADTLAATGMVVVW